MFRPVDDYNIQANEPIASNPDTTTYPSKDFPKTTTNPATYGTVLPNYEDTVFLGEVISPVELFKEVSTIDEEDTDDDHVAVYGGYLKRLGRKLHDDPEYYFKILSGETTLTPAQEGNGEQATISNNTITLKLPYYYLKDEENTRSYACGADTHQADRVGFITYEWKAVDMGGHTLADNNALKDFTTTTMNSVKYP